MTITDLLAFAAGGAMLLATGVLGAAALRIRGRAAFLAAALVVGAATIVLCSTALSFVDLYRRGPVLGGQLVLLVAVVAAWLLSDRPSPPRRWIPSPHETGQAIRRHPAVAVLAGAAAFALLVEAVLAIFVAPNNFDSMTYHLARIGYWLEYHSVLHFPGGTYRQLEFPPNAELLQGWTMILSNGDRFAQLVQLTAMAGTGVLVYLGARLLRFSRAASVFAGMLFMTLPEVVLQSTTTQNDLVAAFFVAAAAVFAVRAISTRAPGETIVAAMALGLAIGTKLTVFLALPALVLIGAAAIGRWRPPGRFLVWAGLALVAAVLLLGSTNYIQNEIDFRELVGGTNVRALLALMVVLVLAAAAILRWRPSGRLLAGGGVAVIAALLVLSATGTINAGARSRPLIPNVTWVGWSFVDLPGFGSTAPAPATNGPVTPGSWIVTATQETAQKILGADAENVSGEGDGFPVDVGTAVHEDYTAYGPIGFVLILPLLIIYAVGWRSPPSRRVAALAALSYLGAMAVLLNADQFVMRYAVTAMALGAPLLARVEGIRWLRSITVLVALFVLVPSLFQNTQKPLGFEDPLAYLKKDRPTQEAGSQSSDRVTTLNEINSHIPSDARIALVAGGNAWEYPFFGPHFSRFVTRIPEGSPEAKDPNRLMREGNFDGVAWVGLSSDSPTPPPQNAQDLGSGTYLLLRARSAKID